MVSGMKYARMPAIKHGSPKTTIGSGFQYMAKLATKGQTSPNMRAIIEQNPKAWLLRFVGNNSAVMTHTNRNPAPAQHLPMRKKAKMTPVSYENSSF